MPLLINHIFDVHVKDEKDVVPEYDLGLFHAFRQQGEETSTHGPRVAPTQIHKVDYVKLADMIIEGSDSDAENVLDRDVPDFARDFIDAFVDEGAVDDDIIDGICSLYSEEEDA